MLELIKHLELLGRGDIAPINRNEGICLEVKSLFGPDKLMHIEYFSQSWKNFSGTPLFPVPCPFGGDPELRYINTTDHWKGKYGDLRRELCLHIAKNMRKLYV